MTRTQNILLLTHRAPYPPDRGDRIRSYHLLRYLAERYQVYLGALVDEPITEQCLWALRELTAERALVPLDATIRWARAAWSLAVGRSATEGLFASRQLAARVRSWATSVEFHAVVAFCSSMVQFIEMPELRGVPLIVDLVDVDSQKWLDYAAASSGWKQWLFRLESARIRLLERSLPARAAAITLVSEAEADIYRSLCPNDQTHALQNGVDLDYFRPDFPVQCQRPNQCVFVGVLDYRPNVDGLVWFTSHVWPLVRTHKPDAVLAIVGKNPSAVVQRLAARPGIRLIGEVADVRPYIAESRFSLAPLQIARGVQNKVLEALAMGKPVLATPQALEGLPIQPEVHTLSATSAEDCFRAICRLYQDEDLCRRLGQAGRDYVSQHHCWQACLQSLASLIRLPVQTDLPSRNHLSPVHAASLASVAPQGVAVSS